jgi:acyl-CoA synthetase (AMP-forming)/AMP-acid ligase II
MHHIHGVVNALLTPIYAGSSVEFLFPFNAASVWQRFALPFLPDQSSPGALREPISFFTAVPTIYSRLLESHSSLPSEWRDAAQKAIAPTNLRLNICGSAALPTPTKQAWTNLTNGNILLERYGMTEVGMALSCGLDPGDRVDGSVGWPLPSVEARLFDTDRGCVIPEGAETDASGRECMGEIQLRGPTVFKAYWRNTGATDESFVDSEDGHGKWFCTGDIAVRRKVPQAGATQSWASGDMYFILGRKSADIIKTGGEKVSALEIEREMLSL